MNLPQEIYQSPFFVNKRKKPLQNSPIYGTLKLRSKMTEKHYYFDTTTEYDEWFDGETKKSQVQVEDRLSKIEDEGHFGTHKDLENGVWELKWGIGRRVYYALIPEKNIILLLGGNKNGQDKDITKAKKILNRYI